MTDITTPGEKGSALNGPRFAHSIAKSGGHYGYVVDGTDLSEFHEEVDTAGVNAFAEVSQDGLTVTLDGGEAFLYGWLCRDRQTTITLPESTEGIVYVGYNIDATLPSGTSPTESENIIIGTDDAFAANDPQLRLYEFSTTSSGISSFVSIRDLGRANAQSPWIGGEGGNINGELLLSSSGLMDHLRIANSDATWEFGIDGLGTSSGDIVVQRLLNVGTEGTYCFTEDSEFLMGSLTDAYEDMQHAVQSPSATKIYVGDEDKSDATDGDVWISTS